MTVVDAAYLRLHFACATDAATCHPYAPRISSVELTGHMLECICSFNSKLNALVTSRRPESAMERARRADEALGARRLDGSAPWRALYV